MPVFQLLPPLPPPPPSWATSWTGMITVIAVSADASGFLLKVSLAFPHLAGPPFYWSVVSQIFKHTSEVLKRYGSSLTEYERGEILHYKKIWYFGLGTPKTTARNEPYNSGFDNKKGEYKTIQHDHIAYRYEVISTIGKGAFGEVVEAYDHRNQQKVALKIIRNRPK